MAFVVVAAFAAFLPAAASADITTTPSTVYGPTLSPFVNPPVGAYNDYTIIQTFEYGNGTEPKAGTEDLKRWVVDSPAGLAGNPNQVPYAQRCAPSDFDPAAGPGSQFVNSNCPASAKVGDAKVYLANDAASNEVPAGSPIGTLTGEIYILQTSPEVPTTLATRFTSTVYQSAVCATFPGSPAAPCTVYPKTQSVLAPVTSGADGDFRLRTIPKDDSSRPNAYGPTGAPYPHPWFNAGATPAHIYRIDQHLYGQTAAAEPFVRYPTRCDSWDSYSYVTAYDSNTNSNSDPDPLGHPNAYFKGPVDSRTPDCASKPALGATASATLSTNTRDSNPQLDVTVSNPSASTGDYPKTVTATLPASVTTDLQNSALTNLCDATVATTGTCPAASKVGTATVTTPFITAGLTGDVYAVQNARAVPDLLIDIAGAGNAINFKLLGVSRFVGPRGNQIQTVFSNLPQSPFTSFTVTIAGGKDSLLTISQCPNSGVSTEDGPITYSIDGYAGGSTTSSTATNFAGCYGKPTVKKIKKCVKRKLKVTPGNLLFKDDIAKVELYAGKKKQKRIAKDTKAPFKFSVKLSSKKYKKGKYKYSVKVTYKPTVDAPKGKVMKSKTSTFKKC